MADFRSNRNVLFSCKYHVVFCPKYRKPVLNPPIDAKLKKLIQQVCDETQSALIEMEVMPDHVHLLVGCDPQYGIHRLVKGIKGWSSRVLRQQFRVLRTRIPTLWTNSYFVSSVGGTPLALGRPRFKSLNRLNSIEGKADAVIRYRAEPVPAVHYSGLVLPLMLDPKDKRDWQREALAARTKYVRIIRREIKGRVRWFCQLVQEGLPPATHTTKDGTVGLDIGPSSIAAVSSDDAILEQLCPSVVEPWNDCRRIQRAMDRSRRATNLDNFDAKGRAIKGKRRWNRSQRYQALAASKRERDRVLAAERKRSHGELANRILGQGTTIKTEELSYKSFQKNYGRSVKVRAPGMLISMLQRKAASAGGGVIEIKTRHTRLSQFDHTTGEYIKKPLSQRVHVFGDGRTEPVQRDLYSAFLATCCDTNLLDIPQVKIAWASAEPLLRTAMSSVLQPASGKGFAQPHVRNGVRAGRRIKSVGPAVEAGDDVAPLQTETARAPERLPSASLSEPPGFSHGEVQVLVETVVRAEEQIALQVEALDLAAVRRQHRLVVTRAVQRAAVFGTVEAELDGIDARRAQRKGRATDHHPDQDAGDKTPLQDDGDDHQQR